ncbi:MAG: hypothetical protein ACD_79C01043G0001 [uncultured bacterium]|nr:MAG: hypothetical protein ACD_79C01043G0001 [uncultured bacterium]
MTDFKICFNCEYESNALEYASSTCPDCHSSLQFIDSIESLTILHADMDAFFANVEIHDNPALAGKPVIVGGAPKSRGVVSTCSYEARKYGVHSAMPLFKAYKLCPKGIFLPVRMKRYVEVSQIISEIFHSFTPDVESISIDEAFLDMKGTEHLFGNSIHSAFMLKKKVKKETGLTVSIGISYNKFLAKLASDINKPDGLFVFTPKNHQACLDTMTIDKMWGIGKATIPLMLRNNINTIKDLRLCSKETLERLFKNQWQRFYNLSRGIDSREITTETDIKSISNEITFEKDIQDKEEVLKKLLNLSEKVSRRLNESGNLKGLTVTLKIKTNQFKTITRSKTLSTPVYLDIDIYRNISDLINKVDTGKIKIRLLGVGISNFYKKSGDLQLTFPDNKEIKTEKISSAINKIKDKFGSKAITRAAIL